MTGLSVHIEYGNQNDATLVNEMETAIGQKYAGIAVSIPDAALNKALCDAKKAGIPVISFNNAAQTGAAKNACWPMLARTQSQQAT
jgi:ABC-type sugar transport system substrate-binding protein